MSAASRPASMSSVINAGVGVSDFESRNCHGHGRPAFRSTSAMTGPACRSAGEAGVPVRSSSAGVATTWKAILATERATRMSDAELAALQAVNDRGGEPDEYSLCLSGDSMKVL